MTDDNGQIVSGCDRCENQAPPLAKVRTKDDMPLDAENLFGKRRQHEYLCPPCLAAYHNDLKNKLAWAEEATAQFKGTVTANLAEEHVELIAPHVFAYVRKSTKDQATAEQWAKVVETALLAKQAKRLFVAALEMVKKLGLPRPIRSAAEAITPPTSTDDPLCPNCNVPMAPMPTPESWRDRDPLL